MQKNGILLSRAALLFTLCALLLTGCGMRTQDVATSSDNNNNDSIQIGISFDSFIIERWQKDRDVFVSTAKEQGAEVNVQNANGDVEEQKKQIEYLINKGVDVIVIVCIDSDSLADVVKKAKEKGIKVISYDRLIHNADTDLYISFDNKMVGTLMGRTIGEDGTIKNVVMIGGSSTDSNVDMVEEAFLTEMRTHSKTVIDSTHLEGWNAELGSTYVEEHPDIISNADAIMCGNDDIATHVIRSLAVSRKAGKIMVVGQDADLSACQHIVEGTQKMTVYKPVEKLASEAARCAIAMARGETIDCDHINDGTYDIPYIALNPIKVTKANMDSVIIDGGFHLREDVYLNVADSAEEQ